MGGEQLIKLSLMHNFIANFVKFHDIYKEFARNRVNELRNLVPARAEPQARLRAMPSAAEIMQTNLVKVSSPSSPT